MTKEALEQGNRIQADLNRIAEAKRSIMAYSNERIELEIKVVKGLMNFDPDESTEKHFTLWSDSPLFIAIAAALEGMREELQEQLDNLSSDVKDSSAFKGYEDNHPIAKTSWFKKVFRGSR